MIKCYICQDKFVYQCNGCREFVCKKHGQRTGNFIQRNQNFICDVCIAKKQEEQAPPTEE